MHKVRQKWWGVCGRELRGARLTLSERNSMNLRDCAVGRRLKDGDTHVRIFPIQRPGEKSVVNYGEREGTRGQDAEMYVKTHVEKTLANRCGESCAPGELELHSESF